MMEQWSYTHKGASCGGAFGKWRGFIHSFQAILPRRKSEQFSNNSYSQIQRLQQENRKLLQKTLTDLESRI